MNTILKVLVFLSLGFLAFVVGNSCLAGLTMLIATTFFVSAGWFAWVCIIGPDNWVNSDRSHGLQGWLVVLHGTYAFAGKPGGILWYAIEWHNGQDVDCSVVAVWQFWWPCLPYCVLGVVLVSVATIAIATYRFKGMGDNANVPTEKPDEPPKRRKVLRGWSDEEV